MVTTKKRNAFHVEAGTHFESGRPVWRLVDDRDGVWAEFDIREAATACLAGYRAIGFVPRPDEPSDASRLCIHGDGCRECRQGDERPGDR